MTELELILCDLSRIRNHHPDMNDDLRSDLVMVERRIEKLRRNIEKIAEQLKGKL